MAECMVTPSPDRTNHKWFSYSTAAITVNMCSSIMATNPICECVHQRCHLKCHNECIPCGPLGFMTILWIILDYMWRELCLIPVHVYLTYSNLSLGKKWSMYELL